MFNASSIGVFFLGMFISMFTLEYAKEKRWHALYVGSGWSLAINGLFCLAAGIWLLTDWSDPLTNATAKEIAHAQSRRRGGLVLLAIRCWPYVLICLGALFGLVGFSSVRNPDLDKVEIEQIKSARESAEGFVASMNGVEHIIRTELQGEENDSWIFNITYSQQNSRIKPGPSRLGSV